MPYPNIGICGCLQFVKASLYIVFMIIVGGSPSGKKMFGKGSLSGKNEGTATLAPSGRLGAASL